MEHKSLLYVYSFFAYAINDNIYIFRVLKLITNINQLIIIKRTMKEAIYSKWNSITAILNNYPKTAGLLMAFCLTLGLLKKYHHKFIVHPQVGGRYNRDNSLQFRHPTNRNLLSQDLQIVTQDKVTLRGWYIKNPNAEQVLVYFHENAGNIGGRLFFIESLIQNTKNSVIIVAYRGFSDSDGNHKPTEKQIMIDSKAILRKAIEIAKDSQLKLFVFGRSLGGAASIGVLSLPEFKNEVRGLILENTFTSIKDVAINFVPIIFYPLRLLVWLVTNNSYNSIDKIKNVGAPILFIKGLRDELVPKILMDRLEQQCVAHLIEHFSLEVPRGDHNGTWYAAGNRYFDTLNEFTNHCSRL